MAGAGFPHRGSAPFVYAMQERHIHQAIQEGPPRRASYWIRCGCWRLGGLKSAMSASSRAPALQSRERTQQHPRRASDGVQTRVEHSTPASCFDRDKACYSLSGFLHDNVRSCATLQLVLPFAAWCVTLASRQIFAGYAWWRSNTIPYPVCDTLIHSLWSFDARRTARQMAFTSQPISRTRRSSEHQANVVQNSPRALERICAHLRSSSLVSIQAPGLPARHWDGLPGHVFLGRRLARL
jgi:hypothetical protein